ncbi:hypothetical protein, partial [Micromonospora sp. NPDC003776]
MTNPHGVEVTGARHPRYDEILTPEALAFLADLHRTFDARRRDLLDRRRRPPAARGGGGPP